MNLEESPENAAFRRIAAQWLAAQAPAFELAASATLPDVARAARAWQAHKADSGYAALTWPRNLGGQGLSPLQHMSFRDEESRYALPHDLLHGGVDVVMPTLFKFGTPDQYTPFLEPTLRGALAWSILFSEPDAGSDISNARLTAIRSEHGWCLNGQKTWCSGAAFCDWGLVLARTDPTLPKHKGLSCFVVNLRSPGIDARPIRFIHGEEHTFADVFFSDVQLPPSAMIGSPGDGWAIFLSTLAIDRLEAGAQAQLSGRNFEVMLRLVQRLEGHSGARIGESDVRRRLADYYADLRAVENLRALCIARSARGEDPGPEAAIGKLVLANRLQEMAALIMDLAGPAGICAESQELVDLETLQAGYFVGASLRIGAGTDEIIRNTIGERLLGLPPESRPDKNVPFNELSKLSFR